MKNYLYIFMLALFTITTQVFSISVTAGANIEMVSYSDSWDEGSTDTVSKMKESEFNFIFQPNVGFKFSEKYEANVFFSISQVSTKYTQNIQYTKNIIETTIGAGLYRYILHSDVLHVSLGPKLCYTSSGEPKFSSSEPNITFVRYRKYDSNEFSVSAQLNFDIVLNKKALLRVTTEIGRFDYWQYHFIRESNIQTSIYKGSRTRTMFFKNLQPSLGISFAL